jgi:hypothetical protein
MTTKTTTKRNCPIPKEGGSRPAGAAYSKKLSLELRLHQVKASPFSSCTAKKAEAVPF